MTQASPQTDSDPEKRSDRIRDLNDALRRGDLAHGQVFITEGVSAQGVEFVLTTVDAVKRFDAFTPDNDPYGERDFGAVEIHDQKIFWKIDAYDLSLRYGSPDPVDPAVTRRVLTIMLASEY